jgi:RNA processing factor Prp31
VAKSDEKPALVVSAERLRDLHQSGKDKEMYESALGVFYGISEIMVRAEDEKNDRLVTYAAPQIADLAIRLGWLERETNK